MGKTLILGVGNPIMTDDAVGLHVARRAARVLSQRDDVEVKESHRGGLDLIDIMSGYEVAVVIDAFSVTNVEVGTLLVGNLEDVARTNHLYGAHGVDLPTALELGRRLGADMPATVHLVGVVVVDAYTVGEEMNPEVAEAVEPAARVVARLATDGEVD